MQEPGFRLRPDGDPLAMARHRHDIGWAQRLAVECHWQGAQHKAE
jgi:hypothetical protein